MQENTSRLYWNYWQQNTKKYIKYILAHMF